MIGTVSVLAALFAQSAMASADHPGVLDKRPLAGPKSARDVREYWTPSRMRHAAGRVLAVAGGRNAKRGAGARSGSPAATRAVAEPDTTSYPNRAVGRIFATIPKVGNVSCTGSVINTETDSFVLTASHCIWAQGFFTNVTFVPGYHDGQSPFGQFPATRLSIPSLVAQGFQLPNDHGAIEVAPSGGRTVEDTVGALGIALFQPPHQTWRAYGYPAEPPFDGETLETCGGRTAAEDIRLAPRGVGIECDMTGGSSGGPWTIRGNLVASNTGYTDAEDFPGILFGPQFAHSAAELYYPAEPERCGHARPTIVGTEGDDRLVGTKKRDVIVGDAGNDVIIGKGRNDKLCGDAGADTINGGGGKDLCDGGPSHDRARKCEKRRHL